MRNEFVAVRFNQAVKNPATTDEFAADQLHAGINSVHPGLLSSKLINIHKVC